MKLNKETMKNLLLINLISFYIKGLIVMYTTLKEVLAKADKYNFTVGSFNTHNLEMLPYMIRAAKDMGSPISIQTSVGTARYIGYGVLASVCKYMADNEGLDIVLHFRSCC